MRHLFKGFAALLIAASTQAMDLKGIVLGSPATTEQIEAAFAIKGDSPLAQFKQMHVKCGVGSKAMQVCNGFTTVAGVSGQLNCVISKEGIVQRMNVTFGSSQFIKVRDAVLEKMGKPSVRRKDLDQNRMGATFENEYLLWKDAAGNETYLREYAGDLDTSILSLTTRGDRELITNTSKGDSKDL
jgi:hypothetical protein